MLEFTPRDIQNQEFKKVIRGYDPVEVDTFLEIISDDFELLLRQKKDLDEKVLKYETELKNYKLVEGTLQETLLEAKRSTTETQESSRREAEMVLRESELKAREITEEAQRELRRLQDEIAALKTQRDSFVRRMKEWVKVLELDDEELAEIGEIQRRRRKGSLHDTFVAKATVQDNSIKHVERDEDQPADEEIAAAKTERNDEPVLPPQEPRPVSAQQQQVSPMDVLKSETKSGDKSVRETQTTQPQKPDPQDKHETKTDASEQVRKSSIHNGFNLINKIIDEKDEKSSDRLNNSEEP